MTTDGTSLADHIEKLVGAAPPLSNAQKDTLAVLLREDRDPNDRAGLDAAIRQQRERREKAELQAKLQEQEAREQAEDARLAAMKRCALYRHFDGDGVLLYVGISANTANRRVQHIQKAKWLRFQATERVTWLPDRADAEREEESAILQENPVFNIRGASPGSRERRLKYLVDHNAWDLLKEIATQGDPPDQLRLID